MEHFSIVQALCRAALAQPSPATKRQIERLRDALKESGESREAASLTGLLSSVERQSEMAPSRISRSRAEVAGEEVTRNTPLPVDRETSTPLADLVLPDQIEAEAPIFEATVTRAIGSLLDEWSSVDALHAVGVVPAKTCLIYGAPGTGKTRLVMWMAKQLMMPVIVARLDGLISSFLGTTSRNIGSLFNFANRYRCVLLLDEFDSLAKLRDDPNEVGEIKRVVNSLLQSLDARRERGVTIGITNHPNLLDSAVWRRFEVQIEIPKPSFDIRLDLVRHFMPPVVAADAHVRLIAWFTDGATGAEIEALVRTYKKASALRSTDQEMGLIDTLRQFVIVNSGRIAPHRREMLNGRPADFAKILLADADLAFDQSDVAAAFGMNKSTVSRWLRASASANETA